MTPPARTGVRFMSCLLCCTHFSLSPFSFSSLDLHPGSAPSKCLSELLRAEPFSCFKQPTGGCFPLQGQPHPPPDSIEENRDPAFPEGLIWAGHVGSTLHILSHLILTTILGRRYYHSQFSQRDTEPQRLRNLLKTTQQLSFKVLVLPSPRT